MLNLQTLSQNMANKKMTRSQSIIPFSWEEKPGISKFNNNNDTHCNQNAEVDRPLQKSQPPPTNYYSSSVTNAAYYSTKISPPPPFSSDGKTHHPYRSSKGLWWRHLDDPFTVAMKECTKNIKHYGGLPSEGKICIASNGFSWNKKIVFSCKKSSSCDVRENNLVRLGSCNNKLPPIPCRERKKRWIL